MQQISPCLLGICVVASCMAAREGAFINFFEEEPLRLETPRVRLETPYGKVRSC